MKTMTLTTQGQFTLNKPLLEHIGVKGGGQVIVKKCTDGSLQIKAKSGSTPLSALQGCINANVHYSDEDIQNTIKSSYINSGISGLENN